MAKLLLVEDDNNLREIYQARLTAEGYDIIAAQNGEEALVVAKEQRPDLIISDVMMPRISGFEMLDILRDTPELRDTKVIMLTALGQAEDQERAGKLGADKYLVKSQVTLEDIVNCARDLLAGTQVVAPSPAEPAAASPVSSDTSLPSAPPSATPAPVIPITADTSPAQPVLATVPAATDTTPPTNNSAVQPTATEPAAFATPFTTTAPVTANSVVAVQDPDPITPAQPMAMPAAPPIETPQISTHATTTLTPTAEDPIQTLPAAPQPSAEAPISSTSMQTMASEEVTVESQIAAFAASDLPAPQTAVEAPQPSQAASALADNAAVANDVTLNDAVAQLAAATNAEPTPVLPPSQQPIPGSSDSTSDAGVVSDTTSDSTSPAGDAAPSTAITPDSTAVTPVISPTPTAEPESEQAAVAGKKVISPINDISHGPDLNDLLAKEVAKEQAGQAPTQQAETVATEPPETPPVNPASASGSTIDPNSIAL